jgi:hypothetical protein
MSRTCRNRFHLASVGILILASATSSGAQESQPPIENALAVRVYGIMDCLTLPAVCEELKLTPRQLAELREKARKIFAAFDPQEAEAIGRQTQIKARSYIPPWLRGVDRSKVVDFAAGEAAAAASRVLTEKQYERLRQITRQKHESITGILTVARGGYSAPIARTTVLEFYELMRERDFVVRLVEKERNAAIDMNYKIPEVDELARKKVIEINAAVYQRALDLFTRAQRKRWHDYIGPVTEALATTPNHHFYCGDLYDAMLYAERNKGEIPLNPYLVLPDGRTTGKEYPDYPRVRRPGR